MPSHHHTLKNIDAIYTMAEELAAHFPDSATFITPIYELLINALEHGNLEIGFAKKTELLRRGRWQEEVMHRLSLPEYASRQVDIHLMESKKECRLTITDQGNGFPWQEYTKPQRPRRRLNGRGLMIALAAKFDEIKFNHKGNAVTCVVHRQNRRQNAA